MNFLTFTREWRTSFHSRHTGASRLHCCEVVFLSVARLAQGPRALNRIWTDVGGSSSGDFLWWYLARFAGVAVSFHFFCVDIAELAGVPAIALAGVCWSCECYVRALHRQLLTPLSCYRRTLGLTS
jgi:hypothetical protein